MLKKIKKYLVELLIRVRKLIPTLPLCEVVSVFKKIKDDFLESNPEADELIDLLTSFFLFLTSIGLCVVFVLIIIVIGGLL